MYTEKNVPGPEYRVRPVVRYVVTRYCHPYTYGEGGYVPGGSEVIAEVPGEERAHEIAEAMKKREDEWLSNSSEKMEAPADFPSAEGLESPHSKPVGPTRSQSPQ